jgi:MFS family permease
MTDRRLLYASAFLRALATGMVGVLLGLYLARAGLDAGAIGLVVAAGLAGAAAASVVAMFAADRIGRRLFLATLAVLAGAGGLALASSSRPILLAAAAFAGMVNGMGRDRGASLVLEQAILPAAATDATRTKAFAWYNVLQDIGHAAGSLAAGLPGVLEKVSGLGGLASFRWSIAAYACLALGTAPLALALSQAAEAPAAPRRERLSPPSRRILWRIASLFGIDSLGGGFLTVALLSYFFYERFGVSAASIGLLFAGARAANALSHLGAAWLAKRIGLVNTMVFTHMPSSFLLVTVAFAPSFPIAAALFLLREGLVEMDVPTRQSYVMAVVRPQERTFASGLTHVVRMAAWAVAPAFAGLFMKRVSLLAPLLVGAGMKVAYDILLYLSFRRIRPPEESTG